MAADTLTTDGGAVVLAPPAPLNDGTTFTQTGFAVMGAAPDEVVVASIAGDRQIVLSGYALTGALLFQTTLAAAANGATFASPSLTTDPDFGVAISWRSQVGGSGQNDYAVIGPDGGFRFERIGATDQAAPAQLFTAPDGFAMEAWNGAAGSSSFQRYTYGGSIKWQDAQSASYFPYADVALGSGSLVIQDNQAQYVGSGASTVTLPGEPAHAVTQVAAAELTDGQSAAVAWVDSGTDYVSIFNTASNSFGPTVGLDWGGASDLHVLALPDGGFVVSWEKGGNYRGEVFDSAGTGGGIIALAGQVAGFDGQGQLYTVGLDSSGQEVVQTYAITGPSGVANPGAVVSTSARTYVAPAGVTDIHLTGSGQNITANSAGDVIWSDNTSNFLRGGAGDDLFHIGRGGDYVYGGGGADTFAFAETPWAAGTIGDFASDDRIDLRGLLASASYTGSDPVADGYLKITNDANGNAQIWADYNQTGNNGWWLVTTVVGVHDASLQLNNGVITYITPPSAVITADTNYWAPASVTSITLTGSQQTVHVSNAQNSTVYSDGGGNTLVGGTGHNLFHIGGGGDTVIGGMGRNTFAFDQTPAVAAAITNFHVTNGDSIDVSGLLANDGYTGSNPIGDGYLKLTANGDVEQLWANGHPSDSNGWTLVANISGGTGTLTYSDGLLYNAISHPGGTATNPGLNYGYDTVIVTGTNGGAAADNGGQTLIDQGANSSLVGGQGDDTLVFGPSTAQFGLDGGVDTIVLNAHPTVDAFEYSWDGFSTGDRIDARNLLDGIGYTGADPTVDGHLYFRETPVDYSHGYPGYSPYQSQLMWDPDGSGGPASATAILTVAAASSAFHYAGGFFTVG